MFNDVWDWIYIKSIEAFLFYRINFTGCINEAKIFYTNESNVDVSKVFLCEEAKIR